MKKIPKICVAGSSNMDLVTSVSRMPVPGETISGSAFHTYFGGKGANQAVTAAKLGADVTMITKVGTDDFGNAYQTNYESVGIRTHEIRRTNQASTGIAAITVDAQGQNAIVIVGGANDLLSPADIEQAHESIRSADVAICQLEVPLETTIRFLEIAHEAGVTTIFNPAPARNLPDAIYPLCDYICPNETEASLMTGISVKTREDALRAGKTLLARGAGAVVMTMGSQGALFLAEEHTFFVEAEKVKAVDTTGAGDSYLGSMAFFLGRGESLESAMRKAAHVAAISVQRHGAQTSFPTYDELKIG